MYIYIYVCVYVCVRLCVCIYIYIYIYRDLTMMNIMPFASLLLYHIFNLSVFSSFQIKTVPNRTVQLEM